MAIHPSAHLFSLSRADVRTLSTEHSALSTQHSALSTKHSVLSPKSSALSPSIHTPVQPGSLPYAEHPSARMGTRSVERDSGAQNPPAKGGSALFR